MRAYASRRNNFLSDSLVIILGDNREGEFTRIEVAVNAEFLTKNAGNYAEDTKRININRGLRAGSASLNAVRHQPQVEFY
jgi:hypothetical protein